MNHFDFTLTAKDGQVLCGQGWQPDDPRGVVVLVHGLGEHVGRYAHVGEAFSQAGFVLLGVDQRGHGETQGLRGHSPSWQALMDDISLVLKEAGQRYPGLPRFLYGHSMGGSEVANYMLTVKPTYLNGVIITSPGLATGEPVGAGKLLLARIMSRINPTFSLDNGLDAQNLATDHSVVERYQADPLVHPKISARLGLGLIESGIWNLAHAGEYPRVPTLLMQGAQDHIVSPAATRQFAQAAKSTIEYVEWEGLYHELHNEVKQAEVLAKMVAFLQAHSA